MVNEALNREFESFLFLRWVKLMFWIVPNDVEKFSFCEHRLYIVLVIIIVDLVEINTQNSRLLFQTS